MVNIQEKDLMCLRCPSGCEMLTTMDGWSMQYICKNICKMGENAVNKEREQPKRILTSTVKVTHGESPTVPVWTTAPIPMEKLTDLIILLREMELEAPVDINQIIIENVFGTGVNVITSDVVSISN